MAHPHHEHRQHKVERRRVGHMLKAYASGGAVHGDEKADMALIKHTVKKSAMKMDGHKPKHRADRRARGGKVSAPEKTQDDLKPYERARGGYIKRDEGGGISSNDWQRAMNERGPNPRDDDDGKRSGGRIQRARGGRTKKKGTTVNIINAPGHALGGAPNPGMMPGRPMPPPMAGAPMPPPAAPPMAGGAPGMPPGGMPPGAMPPHPMLPPQGGMPIRRSGGRAEYAKGGRVRRRADGGKTLADDTDTSTGKNQIVSHAVGSPYERLGDTWGDLKAGVRRVMARVPGQQSNQADDDEPPGRAAGGRVKSGPAWKEGLRSGTQVQHAPGKNDRADIGRGKPITYKTGGRIEASNRVEPATKLPGGSGGGEARLSKEKRARRDYAMT